MDLVFIVASLDAREKRIGTIPGRRFHLNIR